MTLAHGLHSGANCVAEPGQLRNFENGSTLLLAERAVAPTMDWLNEANPPDKITILEAPNMACLLYVSSTIGVSVSNLLRVM